MVKFIGFLTYKKNVSSQYNDAPRHVYKGVPQGGVLSPLLYIVYVSSMSEGLPDYVVISQFADDIALYTSAPTTRAMRTSLEMAIEIICTNLDAIGLPLSPSKTQLIHFHARKRKNKYPTSTKIKIEDHVTLYTGNKIAWSHIR